MTLPHVIRNGGPKRRSTKVNLLNPQPADFAALGYFIPGDTVTFTRAPVATDETAQMAWRFNVLGARSIHAEIYGAAGGASNMQGVGVGGGQPGAMAIADIDCTKMNVGQLYVILGGMGHNAAGDDSGTFYGYGGAGGGGQGTGGGGSGGGGRTAVCKSFSATDEILVAGGGAWGSAGNAGPFSGTRVQGNSGNGGTTYSTTTNATTGVVTDHYYPNDDGGGGGGYYGGTGGTGDTPNGGWGGSSWADPVVCAGATLPVGGAPANSTGFAVFTIKA